MYNFSGGYIVRCFRNLEELSLFYSMNNHMNNMNNMPPGRATFDFNEQFENMRKPHTLPASSLNAPEFRPAGSSSSNSSNSNYVMPHHHNVQQRLDLFQTQQQQQQQMQQLPQHLPQNNTSAYANGCPPSFQDIQYQERQQQQYKQQNHQRYHQQQQQQQQSYHHHNRHHVNHHQQQQQQQHHNQHQHNQYQQHHNHNQYHHHNNQQQQHQQQQQQQQVQQSQYSYQAMSNNVQPSKLQDRLLINKNAQEQQQHYYQQQSHTSDAAQQASGSNYANNTTANNTNNAVNDSSNDMANIALDYLTTVIHCLNENPGQFDSIAIRFHKIFEGMENNDYVLSIAMEEIFEHSIQYSNFRYMGAKLFNLLHMLDMRKDSLFQNLLKLKLDYHRDEVIQFMKSNQQQKVRETALFLAELYMQLRGDDSRILLIAESIVFSLKQLLISETADNVRCVCLTLKLAGYDLTADCPQHMSEIISALDAINIRSGGKYPLAANVIALQKNNWGRQTNSPNLNDYNTNAPPLPLRYSDEPIFYGPDGRELTAEEADFLASGTFEGAAGILTDEEDNDLDDELDDVIDDEHEKDYLEFCRANIAGK